jgi:hypothetical protein
MEAVLGRFEALTRGGSMATDCITQITFRFDPKNTLLVPELARRVVDKKEGSGLSSELVN